MDANSHSTNIFSRLADERTAVGISWREFLLWGYEKQKKCVLKFFFSFLRFLTAARGNTVWFMGKLRYTSQVFLNCFIGCYFGLNISPIRGNETRTLFLISDSQFLSSCFNIGQNTSFGERCGLRKNVNTWCFHIEGTLPVELAVLCVWFFLTRYPVLQSSIVRFNKEPVRRLWFTCWLIWRSLHLFWHLLEFISSWKNSAISIRNLGYFFDQVYSAANQGLWIFHH